MKSQPSLRLIVTIALPVVCGTLLGYFQDTITTNLLSFPPLSILLIGGMVGWIVCAVGYGAAFRVSWLRRLGIEPTLQKFIFILMWWGFTIIGGVIFFSLNRMGANSILGTIILSAGMAMAYNFFLVVLPLFIFWGVQSALRRPRRGRSSRAN